MLSMVKIFLTKLHLNLFFVILQNKVNFLHAGARAVAIALDSRFLTFKQHQKAHKLSICTQYNLISSVTQILTAATKFYRHTAECSRNARVSCCVASPCAENINLMNFIIFFFLQLLLKTTLVHDLRAHKPAAGFCDTHHGSSGGSGVIAVVAFILAFLEIASVKLAIARCTTSFRVSSADWQPPSWRQAFFWLRS